jgi:hypothetical protein
MGTGREHRPARRARLNVGQRRLPYEAPDGDLLFFASNRIGGSGMNDVWVASRQPDTWGDPANLTAVNSPFMTLSHPLPGNRLSVP